MYYEKNDQKLVTVRPVECTANTNCDDDSGRYGHRYGHRPLDTDQFPKSTSI